MTTSTEAPAAQTPPWIPVADTFGARLALVRQHMGWGNLKEAATACGLPVETWRTWERDGVEPRRLTTIAMAIATRTGCDYLWLVHGPNRGGATLSSSKPDARIVAIGGSLNPARSSDVVHTRPVRQTRPTAAVSRPKSVVARRPLTAIAL